MTSHAAQTSSGEAGTATVEFVLVAVVLLVPLAYAVLYASSVQRTSFAVVQAARSAARAYVTAPSAAAARHRADLAVSLAMADQGAADLARTLTVACSATPCLTPGATVQVEVDATVPLAGLPAFLGGGVAGVPVRAVHVEVVDPFVPARP